MFSSTYKIPNNQYAQWSQTVIGQIGSDSQLEKRSVRKDLKARNHQAKLQDKYQPSWGRFHAVIHETYNNPVHVRESSCPFLPGCSLVCDRKNSSYYIRWYQDDVLPKHTAVTRRLSFTSAATRQQQQDSSLQNWAMTQLERRAWHQ